MSMSSKEGKKNNKYDPTFFPSAQKVYNSAGLGFLFGNVCGFVSSQITAEAGSPPMARMAQGFKEGRSTGSKLGYYLPLLTCMEHSLAFSRGKQDGINPFVSGAVIGAHMGRGRGPMAASFSALLIGSCAALRHHVSFRPSPVPTATAPTHTGSQSPAGTL